MISIKLPPSTVSLNQCFGSGSSDSPRSKIGNILNFQLLMRKLSISIEDTVLNVVLSYSGSETLTNSDILTELCYAFEL